MNILFLDDRASATEQIERYLRNIGEHVVFSAGYIYEANNIVEKNTIDCFVVDLNLPPNGHNAKRENSKLFAGWIWIIDIVIHNKLVMIDGNENLPIIIYSEFINEFEEQYNDLLELNKEEWDYFNRVIKIKKFEENTTNHLLKAIESVNKQLRK